MLRGWVVAALLVAGCSHRPSGDPQDAVERFYASAAKGDCPGMLAELAPDYRSEVEAQIGCDELLEHSAANPLEAVVSATADGRRKDTWLVRVRLTGRRTEGQIRVVLAGTSWKIEHL